MNRIGYMHISNNVNYYVWQTIGTRLERKWSLYHMQSDLQYWWKKKHYRVCVCRNRVTNLKFIYVWIKWGLCYGINFSSALLYNSQSCMSLKNSIVEYHYYIYLAAFYRTYFDATVRTGHLTGSVLVLRPYNVSENIFFRALILLIRVGSLCGILCMSIGSYC